MYSVPQQYLIFVVPSTLQYILHSSFWFSGISPTAASDPVSVLQNVELPNAELQNAEFQNIELQNAELQNAKLQNFESYRMSNLTKRLNTKCWILQNMEIQNVDNTKRRKWLDLDG